MLQRRLPRIFRRNITSYLALFLLVMLSTFFIISMIASADTITQRLAQYSEEVCVEDGEFSAYMPLEESDVEEIEKEGFCLEEQFYTDYEVNDSTLRVFEIREKINLITITDGELCRGSHEICLERQYAKARGLSVGDDLSIAGQTFRITGLGCVPDYETPLENLTDPSADSQFFGIAVLTEEVVETLRETGEAR
ncbi:MAG: hypothetical protein LUF34_10015 [Lachnospiraceae bacterium]|nr:hypothetical protein [Lachnospiraceae bacterium]